MTGIGIVTAIRVVAILAAIISYDPDDYNAGRSIKPDDEEDA